MKRKTRRTPDGERNVRPLNPGQLIMLAIGSLSKVGRDLPTGDLIRTRDRLLKALCSNPDRHLEVISGYALISKQMEDSLLEVSLLLHKQEESRPMALTILRHAWINAFTRIAVQTGVEDEWHRSSLDASARWALYQPLPHLLSGAEVLLAGIESQADQEVAQKHVRMLVETLQQLAAGS